MKNISRLFKRKSMSYETKLKKELFVKYLRCELENCSTHGLPYVANTYIHRSERWFWLLCFLSCSSLAFMLLHSQYYRYIETPIVMSVEMDYFNWNVSYPAFTLCPHVKPQFSVYYKRLNETFDKFGNNLESYYWDIIQTSIEAGMITSPRNPEMEALINPKDYARIAAELFLELDNTSITTNTNWPVSSEAVMTEVGMCHVFNSNVAKYDNPRNWGSNSDMEYEKKSIVLSVYDRDFYTQVLDYAEVYKVYIHSPDETILSTTPSYIHEDKGYLSFGVQVWSTRISEELRHSSVKLRKCRFVNEPISKRYPVYSYNHCMLECKIKMIIKLCGCIPHFYRPLPEERICAITELSCLSEYSKEIKTLSTSKETAAKFRDTTNLPKSPKSCGCISSCEGETYMKDFDTFLYQPNVFFMRLRIGISSFPKVRVVRDVILSLYDIILRSGGVVNMCIGTSIISLVELIMIPTRIIIQSAYGGITHKVVNVLRYFNIWR